MNIYLDNAATTKIDSEVVNNVMTDCLKKYLDMVIHLQYMLLVEKVDL